MAAIPPNPEAQSYWKAFTGAVSGALGTVVNKGIEFANWSEDKIKNAAYSACVDYGYPAGMAAGQFALKYGPDALLKATEMYRKLKPGLRIPFEFYLMNYFSPLSGAMNVASWTAWAAVWGYNQFVPQEAKNNLAKRISESPLTKSIQKKASAMFAAVLNEAPEYIKAAQQTGTQILNGDPLEIFGNRIDLKGDKPLKDPYKDLGAVNAMAAQFKRMHPDEEIGELPILDEALLQLLENENPQEQNPNLNRNQGLAIGEQPIQQEPPQIGPVELAIPNGELNLQQPQVLQNNQIEQPLNPIEQVLIQETNGNQLLPPQVLAQNGTLNEGNQIHEENARRQQRILEQKRKTDQELNHLIENVSSFVPLSQMFSLAGILSPNSAEINEIIQAATISNKNGIKPSITEIFLNKYGPNLSLFKKIKIRLTGWLFSTRIFTQTIDTYSHAILSELRSRLSSKRWTENGDITKGLISKISLYFVLRKNAILEYANTSSPVGDIDHYIELASERLFGQSMHELCKEFSRILSDHISPEVAYFKTLSFLNRPCNWIVKKYVKRFLPDALYSTINKANKSTQPHHLPFAKALTDATKDQLDKLEAKLDKAGPNQPHEAPLSGIERLKGLIEMIFYNIQFTNTVTPEAIRKKEKELVEKGKEKDFDEAIQQGIKDAALNGIQALLRFLAEDENSEEMFGNFLHLANKAFQKGENVTPKDYEASKTKLELTVRTLGKKLARQAVKKTLNTNQPEIVDESALKVFLDHKYDARKVGLLIDHLAGQIHAAIPDAPQEWSQETDILRKLSSMTKAIEAFSSEEQLKNDLNPLTPAEREGILRPLIPFYEQLRLIMEKVLSMQELQLQQKNHSRAASDYHQIQEIVVEMQRTHPPETALAQVPLFEEALIRLNINPQIPNIKDLTDPINEMTNALEKASPHKLITEELDRLGILLDDLKQTMIANRPDQRKKTLEKIRELFKKIPAADVQRLTPLINDISSIRINANRDTFERVWNVLKEERELVFKDHNEKRTEYHRQFSAQIAPLIALCQNREEHFRNQGKESSKKLAVERDALTNRTGEFKNLSERIQKENQLHLNEYHLGMIGGTTLGILALFHPAVALMAGAAAYKGLQNGGELLAGGQDRNGGLAKIGAAAIGGGIAGAIGAGLPLIGPPLAVAGAAFVGGAAGNRATEQIIDAGEDTVFAEIEKFFEAAYPLFMTGVYKGVAKGAMKQTIEAYSEGI